MNMPSIHFGLGGKLKVSVVERGVVVREYPVIRNLILNQGLDTIGSQPICECMHYAACGTGSTPTEADGGAATISIVSGTVTVSTIGFLAGGVTDTGKTIKLTGSGNTYLIVAPISTTQCSVAPTDSIGPENFIIYNTNQTALTAETDPPGRTQTYLTGAPNCQTVTSGNVTTHTRTFDFLAEAGPVTYNEVGFSHLGTGGSNLFSRVKLPSGVPLTAGQQLRVQYSLAVTITPITPLTYGVSPVIGWNTGTGTMQQIAVPLAFINSVNGLVTAGNNAVDGLWYASCDPATTLNLSVGIGASSAAHPTYGSLHNDIGDVNQQVSNSVYVSGSYTRDHFTTFAVGDANAVNWRNFTIFQVRSFPSVTVGPRFLFDLAQTKLSTFTLTLGFRNTWGRLL